MKIKNLLNNNSFLIGFGSILDISGDYFNYNKLLNTKKSDSEILLSDWLKISDDFKLVNEKLLKELKSI